MFYRVCLPQNSQRYATHEQKAKQLDPSTNKTRRHHRPILQAQVERRNQKTGDRRYEQVNGQNC